MQQQASSPDSFNNNNNNNPTNHSSTTPSVSVMQQNPQPPSRSPRIMRPPYVDPNTNIIYDTDNPEYEGWLTKQSSWIKVLYEYNICLV
jgi:hypothetical protein